MTFTCFMTVRDNPSATRKAIDNNRWMHTEDIGVMDEEGYVNIIGRIKDMIIRGGENVYPREIEELLYTHPKISDVQVYIQIFQRLTTNGNKVIGVPHPTYGTE